jgi:NAD-specific glutamate dehydrogenase
LFCSVSLDAWGRGSRNTGVTWSALVILISAIKVSMRALPGERAANLVRAWLRLNERSVLRCRETITNLYDAEELDVAMLSVALQDLGNLAQLGDRPHETGKPEPYQQSVGR